MESTCMKEKVHNINTIPIEQKERPQPQAAVGISARSGVQIHS